MLQNNSEEPCLQKIEELIQEEEFKIEKHLFWLVQSSGLDFRQYP